MLKKIEYIFFGTNFVFAIFEILMGFLKNGFLMDITYESQNSVLVSTINIICCIVLAINFFNGMLILIFWFRNIIKGLLAIALFYTVIYYHDFIRLRFLIIYFVSIILFCVLDLIFSSRVPRTI